jgi:hypothetical protein
MQPKAGRMPSPSVAVQALLRGETTRLLPGTALRPTAEPPLSSIGG